jgi:hypothetical protein
VGKQLRLSQPCRIQPAPCPVGAPSESFDPVSPGCYRTREDVTDGDSHEAIWSPDTFDSTFGLIRKAADSANRTPSIEALVQHVELTDDAGTRASEIAKIIPGASRSDVLGSPFVWIGSPEEIVSQLHRFEERWGVTRFVVREPALIPAKEIIRLLNAGG